ncbi:helix-turn-helix transcriptional regulator [Nonomuraea africana]|uniref:helix-turn-helix transcriptional regulator n=1 Tax=Nonomuraea africana TaxID=46171 RepID=UPI00340D2293
MLWGRIEERATLKNMLAAAAEGKSSAVIIRGQPGIGKTALLDYAADAAIGMRILRCVAVESEVQLPYAALHLLLRPLLGDADRLPDRLRSALLAAFGLGPASSGDPFLVGLAVLTLLSEAAEESPLLCLVDDAQWLDQASAEALLFAARRLDSEGIVVLFAQREDGQRGPDRGIPWMRLGGLDREAAMKLVAEHGAEFDERLFAETQGNPLALLELRGMAAGESEIYRLGPVPLTGRVQEAFQQQLRDLPEATRTVLLMAAADEYCDLHLVLRAASTVGADVVDFQPAEERGLVRLGQTVEFRHPLVRAAAYYGAPLGARLAVHAAIAKVCDDPQHADRRAWHLARAATGPNEETAAELERTAQRAAERVGHVAAAFAYERAAQLSVGGAAIGRRLTLASESALAGGKLDHAGSLAERAISLTTDPLLRARLDQIRAIRGLSYGELRVAHDILVSGASSIAHLAPERALWMIMEALHCAWFMSFDAELVGGSVDLLGTLSLDADHPLMSLVWLLRWDTATALGRSTAGFPPIADVIQGARKASGTGGPRGLVSAAGCALLVSQDVAAHEMAETLVEDSRAQGTIAWLSPGLVYLAESGLFLGRHRDARVHVEEAARVATDTGQRQWLNHANGVLSFLSAVGGDEEACIRHTEEALSGVSAGAGSVGIVWAQWGRAMLDLGMGRIEAALKRFQELSRSSRSHLIPGVRSLPDHVEAAVRLGRPELAMEPFKRYSDYAARMSLPSLDAIVQRCQAMIEPDDGAEEHYLAALSLHDRNSLAFEHARTRLLYGEWLRRARRKVDAREQLGSALEAFELLGAAPWAERARTELGATGVTAPSPPVSDVFSTLTPQELQIVRLAGRGLSNREIATQLFLSPKTVAHHLYKAFPKLGIASRGELAAVLA